MYYNVYIKKINMKSSTRSTHSTCNSCKNHLSQAPWGEFAIVIFFLQVHALLLTANISRTIHVRQTYGKSDIIYYETNVRNETVSCTRKNVNVNL